MAAKVKKKKVSYKGTLTSVKEVGVRSRTTQWASNYSTIFHSCYCNVINMSADLRNSKRNKTINNTNNLISYFCLLPRHLHETDQLN